MSERQQWLKLHIAVDVEDLSLQSLVITYSTMGDFQVFPELLKQISQEQKIEAVYGDGAYDTKGYYQAIYQLGARAIIPSRKMLNHGKGTIQETKCLRLLNF